MLGHWENMGGRAVEMARKERGNLVGEEEWERFALGSWVEYTESRSEFKSLHICSKAGHAVVS